MAFGTNIDQLFAPIGFTNLEIAALGAAVIIVGILVSFISGYILSKYHKYMLMLRVSTFGTFILSSAAIGTFLTKDVLIVAINMIVAAAFLIPVIPLSIDFASELTFPLEETVTTGFLLMSAQAFGFIIALLVL